VSCTVARPIGRVVTTHAAWPRTSAQYERWRVLRIARCAFFVPFFGRRRRRRRRVGTGAMGVVVVHASSSCTRRQCATCATARDGTHEKGRTAPPRRRCRRCGRTRGIGACAIAPRMDARAIWITRRRGWMTACARSRAMRRARVRRAYAVTDVVFMRTR